MSSIVAYTGPSMLDGSPTVCLISLGSSNVKTGPMLQTWIMRADLPPVEASKHGDDVSVCGSCPRRHSLQGDCYVQVFHGPRATYTAWERSGRPFANWREHVAELQGPAAEHGLRFGSYGDPAAVPFGVWQSLLDVLKPRLHTGYTHQWQNASLPVNHLAWLRRNVMASADTLTDVTKSLEKGWRFFAALPPGVKVTGAVECLATRLDSPRTCETCGICNGTQDKASRTSVYLTEHGVRSHAKHKRSEKLNVIS